MKTYLLNPSIDRNDPYIREGRCMQKASSWATIWPPITLAVLAQLAMEKGSARLVDGNVEDLSSEELFSDIKDFAPDLLVINTGFPSIDEDMSVAQKIKDEFPKVKLLAFGVFFTLLEKEALEPYPFLDLAILGEPEEAFRELLAVLGQGGSSFDQIQGLMYRRGGELYVNSKRALIADLDQIPRPARDLLKNDRYRLPHNDKTFTLINVARGCPFPCIFCIVQPYYGNTVRKHSVQYVMDEIRECIEKYGVQEFLFWEEVFTLDKKYAMELCQAILDGGFSFKWAATTRVGLLDEELLAMMEKAGCYLLGLGIESGIQEILDNARKDQTLDDIRNAVALCKKAGIQTMGHFVFGLPGETRKTAEKTIQFMQSLDLDYMQSYCDVPYPKTEYGTMAKEKGWVRSVSWSRYDFGGPSIVDMGTLTPEDVTYFRERAFKKFYYRPFYLIKKVREFSFHRLFTLSKFTRWIKSRKKEQEVTV
jgi:anaerobic magnesium-protoporphyrin IX monomethyl ester cyclase